MGWSKYLLKWKKNSNDIQGWIIYRYLFLVFRGPINPRAFRTTRCVVRLEIFLARMHGSMLVTENSSSLTLIFLCLVTCQVISSLTHTQKKEEAKYYTIEDQNCFQMRWSAQSISNQSVNDWQSTNQPKEQHWPSHKQSETDSLVSVAVAVNNSWTGIILLFVDSFFKFFFTCLRNRRSPQKAAAF